MVENDVIGLDIFGSRIAASLKEYEGDYMVMSIRPPKSFIGSTIRDLQIGARFQCQILCIIYLEGHAQWTAGSPEWKNMKIAPTASDIIPDHTALIFLGRKADLTRIRELD